MRNFTLNLLQLTSSAEILRDCRHSALNSILSSGAYLKLRNIYLSTLIHCDSIASPSLPRDSPVISARISHDSGADATISAHLHVTGIGICASRRCVNDYIQSGIPGAFLTHEFINNHLSVISVSRPDGETRWQIVLLRACIAVSSWVDSNSRVIY